MPSIQLISLTALCLHYSSLTILMHLSRTGQQTSNYRASSAVVITELCKLLISLIFAFYNSLLCQSEQPTSRPSPHSRFEPQFDSLAEEEEEETDSVNRPMENEQDNGIEWMEDDQHCQKLEDSRWNEESNQLVSEMISQIQSNSSKARERTFSSEVHLPSQVGKRRRLISGNNGTTSPDKSAVQCVSHVRSNPDYSHRMSVQASPQLTRLSQNYPTYYPLVRLLDALDHLRASVFSPGWPLLAIPAVMFVIQNNLQYLAASNLSVAVFQITYQLKILTTALCSVILLKRRLKKTQWVALVLLTAGVAIVQLNSQQPNTRETKQLTEDFEQETGSQMNQLLGLVAVVAACISSGFASVYLERMLKSTDIKTSNCSPELSKKRSTLHPSSPSGLHQQAMPPSSSIWIRNIQLSSFGLIVSMSIVPLENQIENPVQVLKGLMRTLIGFHGNPIDLDNHNKTPTLARLTKQKLMEKILTSRVEFFQGFSSLTWLVIFFQVTGGILNSAVMKYSNNINKNFSICLSIILSILFSNLFFPTDHQTSSNHLDLQFFVGSLFVILSTWLFNI